MKQTTPVTARLLRLDDEDAVIRHTVKLLKRKVNCRWIAFYLFDRNGKTFVPSHCHGLPPRWRRLFESFPLDATRHRLIQRVTSRPKPLLMEDPASSELISPLYRSALRSQVLLAVPLTVQHQVMGLALIARMKRYGTFSLEEVSTIREMLDFSALMTSHIRLFDESLEMALEMARRVDVIMALDDINKALSSSLRPDRIVSTAVERIAGLFDAELTAILNTETSPPQVLASRSDRIPLSGGLAPGDTPPLGSLLRSASRNGSIESTGNLALPRRSRSLEHTLASSGIRSLLAVPVTNRQTTAALLILADRRTDHFSGMETFAVEKIASQLGVALENARLFQDMKDLFFSTVASLANAIDAKSAWTKGHSERVMHIAEGLARSMGLDEEETERIRIAGLLHDIGKIGIIEELLEKPLELDDDEFPPIRLHPEKGVTILKPIQQLHDIIPAIRHHHEWFDGTGYPDRLRGKEIPLAARIIAVADSFDAMIADRPYRKGRSVDEALDELQRCAGTQFDPDIVTCFRDRTALLLKKKALLPDGGECRCNGIQ